MHRPLCPSFPLKRQLPEAGMVCLASDGYLVPGTGSGTQCCLLYKNATPLNPHKNPLK